jgi:hypothetical protein
LTSAEAIVSSERTAVLAWKTFEAEQEASVPVEQASGPAGEASTSFEAATVPLEEASAYDEETLGQVGSPSDLTHVPSEKNEIVFE